MNSWLSNQQEALPFLTTQYKSLKLSKHSHKHLINKLLKEKSLIMSLLRWKSINNLRKIKLQKNDKKFFDFLIVDFYASYTLSKKFHIKNENKRNYHELFNWIQKDLDLHILCTLCHLAISLIMRLMIFFFSYMLNGVRMLKIMQFLMKVLIFYVHEHWFVPLMLILQPSM